MRPNSLEKPNTARLEILLEEYLIYIDSDDYSEDNDYDQYIFETALETFYGEKVWDWVNSKLK